MDSRYRSEYGRVLVHYHCSAAAVAAATAGFAGDAGEVAVFAAAVATAAAVVVLAAARAEAEQKQVASCRVAAASASAAMAGGADTSCSPLAGSASCRQSFHEFSVFRAAHEHSHRSSATSAGAHA